MHDEEKDPSSIAVGIFDSGVGGLSVAEAVQAKVPQVKLYYYCDNKNFPYGPKSEVEVCQHVESCYRDWIAACSLDVIVIACNTASTVALPLIRSLSKVPVVGVVPAIKPAAQLSKTGVIALVATPGTILRRYTQDLIDQFANGRVVLKLGSSRLVEMAEEKLRGEKVNLEELRGILAPLFADNINRVDQLILGCTHFPLLSAEILAACFWPVGLVDSSAAIANRVDHLLGHISDRRTVQGGTEFRFSADTREARLLEPALRRRGYNHIVYGPSLP